MTQKREVNYVTQYVPIGDPCPAPAGLFAVYKQDESHHGLWYSKDPVVCLVRCKVEDVGYIEGREVSRKSKDPVVVGMVSSFELEIMAPQETYNFYGYAFGDEELEQINHQLSPHG